jgi:hypothetical protein
MARGFLQCQLAALAPPARMGNVEEIAGTLEKMPPKSTYFYPKLLSPELVPDRARLWTRVGSASRFLPLRLGRAFSQTRINCLLPWPRRAARLSRVS